MDLSVVIPARNEEDRLPEQLDALLAQEWDGAWEIVVADNGSTDGTAALVRRYAARDPRVRLLDASERANKSYAMNKAVRLTDSPIVAFCDADDVVSADWVAVIATGLRTHEVVTGPNEIDLLNEPWLAGSRGRSANDAVGTFFGIFPCIRGNGWGITRRAWDALGGMSESFLAVEDIELSLRCWLDGIEVVGLPQAVVHYRYRSDARSLWRQGYAYGSHRPMIVRLLREAGKPTPPRFVGWRSWLVMLARVPTIVTAAGRARWLWIAGNRFGQVVGSVRHRTLMV